MEFSIREWLILIGVLLIVLVLLDAFRRYRQERGNAIRMARMSFGAGGGFESSEPEVYGSELPGGGARVLPRDDSIPEGPESTSSQLTASARIEPHLGGQPVAGSTGDQEATPAINTEAPAAPAGRESRASQDRETTGDEEAVFVLKVLAGNEKGFLGTELLQILLACDVRYGDMNIFHRHELGQGEGEVQFSVANAVEPGTFDLDNIDHFSTPGITFFMRLPGPDDPLAAYDCMVETARCIVKNLDGSILDESHNVLDAKSIDSSRARINAFARHHETTP